VQILLATRIALVAAGYLARHCNEGWIAIGRIATAHDLPEMYLHRIMQQMIRANIIKSKRGPNGGFQLARPVKDISMLEIIEAAQGPNVYMIDLSEIDGRSPFGSGLEEVLTRASKKAASILKEANLGQMVEPGEGAAVNGKALFRITNSKQAERIVDLAKERLGPDLAYMIDTSRSHLNHLVRFKSVADMCCAKREEKGLSFKDIASQLQVHQYRLKHIELNIIQSIVPDVLDRYIELLGLGKEFKKWMGENSDVYMGLGQRA